MEDVAHTTRSLLSNTSRFKKHRIEIIDNNEGSMQPISQKNPVEPEIQPKHDFLQHTGRRKGLGSMNPTSNWRPPAVEDEENESPDSYLEPEKRPSVLYKSKWKLPTVENENESPEANVDLDSRPPTLSESNWRPPTVENEDDEYPTVRANFAHSPWYPISDLVETSPSGPIENPYARRESFHGIANQLHDKYAPSINNQKLGTSEFYSDSVYKHYRAFGYPRSEDPMRPLLNWDYYMTWKPTNFLRGRPGPSSSFNRDTVFPDPFSFEIGYRRPDTLWQKWIEQMEKLQGKEESSQEALLHPLQQFEANLRPFIHQRSMKTSRSTSSGDLDTLINLRADLQEASSIPATDDEEHENSPEDTKTSQQLMGRRKIVQWKACAGGAKDWRQHSLAKVSTKRQRYDPDNSQSKPPARSLKTVASVAPRLGSGEFVINPAMPAIALKSQAPSPPKLSILKLRSINYPGLQGKRRKYMKKHPKRVFPDDSPVIDTSKPPRQKFLILPFAEFEAYYQQIQHPPSQDTQSKPSDNASFPLTIHYPGEILLYPYRLLFHLRSESHYEAYALDSLITGLLYEAKVYTLRGIHPNQRKRRIENLKKITALPSFIISFDWNGKKYAIFQPETEERVIERNNVKLGAIGRRNTKEYGAAFPELPKSSKTAEGMINGCRGCPENPGHSTIVRESLQRKFSFLF